MNIYCDGVSQIFVVTKLLFWLGNKLERWLKLKLNYVSYLDTCAYRRYKGSLVQLIIQCITFSIRIICADITF